MILSGNVSEGAGLGNQNSGAGAFWESDCGRYKIYCGDCADVIPLLPVVDAVFTDPPYGINKDEWDASPFTQRHLDLLLERSHGPVVVYGGTSPQCMRHMLSLQPSCDRVCVWRVLGYTAPTGGMFWTWQPLYVWRSQFCHGWDSIEFLSAPPTKTGDHPCQKSVDVAQYWLSRMKNVSTVLDPFMGSGTVGVACIRLGLRFIGIEVNEGYCRIAAERLKCELSRLSLFPAKITQLEFGAETTRT